MRVFIWVFAILVFLDNVGYKVSTILAGLGIGGAAIALASQSILKDLFSYFSILFDRPFEIGDFIIMGEYLGTVEHIGIKTTRLRSLTGEEIICSNTDLTGLPLRNYKRMACRRVCFKLGVVYQTSLEKLKIIPGLLEKIIRSVEDTRFDRAHFAVFNDSRLTLEIVYYVLSNDYNRYMDIHQKILFSVKQEFESNLIEFAYPTQTLYLTK